MRITTRVRVAFVALIVLLQVACESPTAPLFNCLKTFSIVAGNNQTAAPGATLTSPLVARGGAAGGGSMYCTGLGVNVTWSVESGGGSIRPVSSERIEDRAAVWTLGPAAGPQTVRATASWADPKDGVQTVMFGAFAESPR